ncbi:MAG: deaminase, partial [Opitutaceae bacterium]
MSEAQPDLPSPLEKRIPSQLVRDDTFFMALAYNQAIDAWRRDEVPIGAVIEIGGEVVASAHNTVEGVRDPTAHAEMLARTLELHPGQPHTASVPNAHNLQPDHAPLAAMDVNAQIADLSKVPEAIRGGVRNNAGGHSNHAFFWTIMAPGKGGAPKGSLATAISGTFGDFDK